MTSKGSRLTAMNARVAIPMKWATGKAIGRFLTELRDNRKIWGLRCPKCHWVMVPPQDYCGRCFVDADEWVELSDQGTLVTYTIVYEAFPEQPFDPPYVCGLIQLDGADTALLHFIRGEDLDKISCGLRLQAVWREEREGTILDISYFKLLGVRNGEQ